VPDALYHLPAARSDDQRAYMADLEERRICVFCPEHQRAEVEIDGEHFYVTRNLWPYRGTKEHWLIVPRAHVRAFDELPDEAAVELWALKRRLKGDAAATATVERSGDMRYNGGSVAHLHIHFVILDEAPEKTVRFRVSAWGEQD
jgi:diadenosine tetraphosphate (Ap4A) HIT family hydrolase